MQKEVESKIGVGGEKKIARPCPVEYQNERSMNELEVGADEEEDRNAN